MVLDHFLVSGRFDLKQKWSSRGTPATSGGREDDEHACDKQGTDEQAGDPATPYRRVKA